MVLGRLDIGLSVVVLNAKKRGIEIDGTEAVHHFRVCNFIILSAITGHNRP